WSSRLQLLPRIPKKRLPIRRRSRIDLRKRDAYQAAAPAIGDAVHLKLAAVDAHRNRARQQLPGIDAHRVDIDKAAAERAVDRRRAIAGRHGPPALGDVVVADGVPD